MYINTKPLYYSAVRVNKCFFIYYLKIINECFFIYHSKIISYSVCRFKKRGEE